MYVGRNYERADLRGKDLQGVNFTCGNFRGATLDGADLRGADFTNCDLSRASLHNVNAQGATFALADLTGAYLKGADFTGANMYFAYLRGVIAKNAKFENADLTGCDLARGDFLGARFDGALTEKMHNLDTAVFYWFIGPDGGRPMYRPFPGCMVLTESQLGNVSWQENAGMGQSRLEYKEPLVDFADSSATAVAAVAGKEEATA